MQLSSALRRLRGNGLLYCLANTKLIFIQMKTKHPAHIMFWVVTSDGDVIIFFQHRLRLNMETYIKCLEVVLLVWSVRVATERLYVSQQDCATQARKPSVGFKNISATTSLLTSSCLTPQIAVPLIFLCGVQLSERPTKLRVTSKMN